MKQIMKVVAAFGICGMMLMACESDDNQNAPIESEGPLSMVGKVTTRTASDEELSGLVLPTEEARVGCALGSDTGCSEASDDVVYYIQNCTTYAKSWPATGDVVEYYKSISYYVDSDSDINLDNYEADLQDHVDEIIDEVGAAAYIDASIIYWTCEEVYNNSAVILYTVYL